MARKPSKTEPKPIDEALAWRAFEAAPWPDSMNYPGEGFRWFWMDDRSGAMVVMRARRCLMRTAYNVGEWSGWRWEVENPVVPAKVSAD